MLRVRVLGVPYPGKSKVLQILLPQMSTSQKERRTRGVNTHSDLLTRVQAPLCAASDPPFIQLSLIRMFRGERAPRSDRTVDADHLDPQRSISDSATR